MFSNTLLYNYVCRRFDETRSLFHRVDTAAACPYEQIQYDRGLFLEQTSKIRNLDTQIFVFDRFSVLEC